MLENRKSYHNMDPGAVPEKEKQKQKEAMTTATGILLMPAAMTIARIGVTRKFHKIFRQSRVGETILFPRFPLNIPSLGK